MKVCFLWFSFVILYLSISLLDKLHFLPVKQMEPL